jgi:hypothetical protein
MRKYLPLAAYTIVLAISISVAAYFYLQTKSYDPLRSYKDDVKYQIYSASKSDYDLDKSSIKVDGNIISYRLTQKDKEISVSQQPLPRELSSFRLDGFNEVVTPIGKAYAGKAGDRFTAIVTTTTTLISISGNSESGVMGAAQALKAL